MIWPLRSMFGLSRPNNGFCFLNSASFASRLFTESCAEIFAIKLFSMESVFISVVVTVSETVSVSFSVFNTSLAS